MVRIITQVVRLSFSLSNKISLIKFWLTVFLNYEISNLKTKNYLKYIVLTNFILTLILFLSKGSKSDYTK